MAAVRSSPAAHRVYAATRTLSLVSAQMRLRNFLTWLPPGEAGYKAVAAGCIDRPRQYETEKTAHNPLLEIPVGHLLVIRNRVIAFQSSFEIWSLEVCFLVLLSFL